MSLLVRKGSLRCRRPAQSCFFPSQSGGLCVLWGGRETFDRSGSWIRCWGISGVAEETFGNRGERRGRGRIAIVVDRIERGLAPVVAQRCQVVAKCISELAGVLHHRRRSGAVSFDTAGDSRSFRQSPGGSVTGSFHQNYRIGDRHQAEQVTAKFRPLRCLRFVPHSP